jgi:hypothetical protein
MHPYDTFFLADEHIRELQAVSARRRLRKMAHLGRGGGARNTAPALAAPVPLPFVGPTGHERQAA